MKKRRSKIDVVTTSGFTVVVGGVKVCVPRPVELAGPKAIDAYVQKFLGQDKEEGEE
jgi:hypothetical protein